MFHGKVLRSEVANALKQNDVFVFASLSEGLSLACLEALSSGVPILCTANTGVSDFINDGLNGFTIDAGDRAALEKYVRWFLVNKDKIPDMSKRSTETGEIYTWEHYSQVCVKALREIIK